MLTKLAFSLPKGRCCSHRLGGFSPRHHRTQLSNLSTRITDYNQFLTKTSQHRKPMPMRELYPFLTIAGMINLGNGMPNTDTFPFTSITATTKDGNTIELNGVRLNKSLQYSATDGTDEFVRWIREHMELEHGLNASVDKSVMVTNGSQDGLSKAIDMLVDENTTVVLEDPSYPGALQAFRANRCNLVGVEIDKHGIVPESLDAALRRCADQGRACKVLYTIPTGHNPAGCTMTPERRARVYSLATRFNLIVLEDDPYYHLKLDQHESHVTSDQQQQGGGNSLLSLDVDNRVVRFDSLSKVISSGVRLGWVTGPAPLVKQMALHQQVSAMQASSLTQALVGNLFKLWGHEGFNTHTKTVQAFYKQQRDTLSEICETHLKGLAEWHLPSSGMFLWIRCLNLTDTTKMVKEKGVKRKVLVVPGSSFAVKEGTPSPFIRLAFSQASRDHMLLAVQRIAEMLKEEQQV